MLLYHVRHWKEDPCAKGNTLLFLIGWKITIFWQKIIYFSIMWLYFYISQLKRVINEFNLSIMESAFIFWLIGMKFPPTLDLTRYFLFLTYIRELECSLNMKHWILKLLSWVMSSFVYCVPFSLLLHKRLWLGCVVIILIVSGFYYWIIFFTYRHNNLL